MPSSLCLEKANGSAVRVTAIIRRATAFRKPAGRILSVTASVIAIAIAKKTLPDLKPRFDGVFCVKSSARELLDNYF